jgi:methylphosphotriester-DNA--protein-cysteine methyltransferase
MDRFEAAIAGDPPQMPTETELAKAARVSTSFLNVVSAAVLGMAPSTYERRKWLRKVDLALVHAIASEPAMVEIARQYGVTDFETFLVEYASVYGEPPSVLASAAHRMLVASRGATPGHGLVETRGPGLPD